MYVFLYVFIFPTVLGCGRLADSNPFVSGVCFARGAAGRSVEEQRREAAARQNGLQAVQSRWTFESAGGQKETVSLFDVYLLYFIVDGRAFAATTTTEKFATLRATSASGQYSTRTWSSTVCSRTTPSRSRSTRRSCANACTPTSAEVKSCGI